MGFYFFIQPLTPTHFLLDFPFSSGPTTLPDLPLSLDTKISST